VGDPEDYGLTEYDAQVHDQLLYGQREQSEFALDLQLAELAKRGEPAHVLLTCAIIEEELERLLLSVMRPMSNSSAKKLFNGPLSSFGAKAYLAYALKLIEEDTLCDLKAIKDIRNAFAHTSSRLEFNSPAVLDLFKRFNGWRPKGVEVKDFFFERAESAVNTLSSKIDELMYRHATASEPADKANVSPV
jgi:DNA-binding MltR family transcriptional regulator